MLFKGGVSQRKKHKTKSFLGKCSIDLGVGQASAFAHTQRVQNDDC